MIKKLFIRMARRSSKPDANGLDACSIFSSEEEEDQSAICRGTAMVTSGDHKSKTVKEVVLMNPNLVV